MRGGLYRTLQYLCVCVVLYSTSMLAYMIMIEREGEYVLLGVRRMVGTDKRGGDADARHGVEDT